MFFISLFPLLSFLNHWELLVSEFIIQNYLKSGNKTFQKLCLGLLSLYQQLQMQPGMKSEQRRIKREPKEYFRMWSKGIDRGKSLWNVEAFSFLLLVCARKTLNSNCWRKKSTHQTWKHCTVAPSLLNEDIKKTKTKQHREAVLYIMQAQTFSKGCLNTLKLHIAKK